MPPATAGGIAAQNGDHPKELGNIRIFLSYLNRMEKKNITGILINVFSFPTN